MLRKLFTLVLLVGLVWSCDDDLKSVEEGEVAVFSRLDFLSNVVDNHMLPEYDSFSNDLDDLLVAKNGFFADKSISTLVTLRNVHVKAYSSFQAVLKYDIGIAADRSYYLKMNSFPFDITSILKAVENQESINFESVLNQDLQGFPALDYLVNGLGTTDDEIVSVFSGSSGDYYTNYLDQIVDRMISLTKVVKDDLDNGFAEKLKSERGFTNEVINMYIETFESRVRRSKVDFPSGKLSGVKNANLIESLYAPELSRDLLVEAFKSAKSFYEGTNDEGASLSNILKSLDRDGLDAQIRLAFLEAETSILSLDKNLNKEVLDNNNALLKTRDEIQDIVRFFKSDLVSVLGVPITFQDNDGD